MNHLAIFISDKGIKVTGYFFLDKKGFAEFYYQRNKQNCKSTSTSSISRDDATSRRAVVHKRPNPTKISYIHNFLKLLNTEES
jgi:hypothetical protein